jgi:transcriptional regulator with XRE-family HTH domain
MVGVIQAPSPLLVRVRLAEELRALRERAGLTQFEVVGRVGWSLSKFQRIETSVNGISVTDTMALLGLYGIHDSGVAERLLAMASHARSRDRYTPYRKYFTPEYEALLACEASASVVRSVNAFVLPAILQTPRYATALLSVKHSGEQLAALIETHALRQEILGDEEGPSFVFVLDETTLHRHVGGRDVLLEQLRRLQEMADRSNIVIRIVPFSARVHLGLWEMYTIMTMPGSPLTSDQDETIVYRVGDSERLVRNDARRILRYKRGFDDALSMALDEDASRQVVDRVVWHVEQGSGSRVTPSSG